MCTFVQMAGILLLACIWSSHGHLILMVSDTLRLTEETNKLVRTDPQYVSFSSPHSEDQTELFFLFLKQSEHLRQHLTHHFHSNVKLIADIPGAGVSSLGWCAAFNGHALSPSQYPGWDVRGKPETTMLPWQRRGDGNNYQCLLWKRA